MVGFSEMQQNVYSAIFVFIFIIGASVLLYFLIKKIIRDKSMERKKKYHTKRRTPTSKICALTIMVPSFFEFLMNTYYHIILKGKDAIWWYSIIDGLVILCAYFVYRSYSFQWTVFIFQIVQVYSFLPSILNHIDEGLSWPLMRFFGAFVYYIISACVMLRVMYPHSFERVNKLAKL